MEDKMIYDEPTLEEKQKILEQRKNKKLVKPKNFKSLKAYLWNCLKHSVTGQSYGPGTERWLTSNSSRLEKDKCKTAGDAKDLITGDSYEIKFTIASLDGKTNYVQIRPHYNASHYFLGAFDPELDKLEFFVISKKDVVSIIAKHGGYAHGSKKTQGNITKENIKNNSYEYALRPNVKKDVDVSLQALRRANQINKPEWQWLKTIIN